MQTKFLNFSLVLAALLYGYSFHEHVCPFLKWLIQVFSTSLNTSLVAQTVKNLPAMQEARV